MKALFLVLAAVAMLFSSALGAGSAKPKKSRLYLSQRQARKAVKSSGVYLYPPYARGKKGRKYIRRFSLRENLTNDKLKAIQDLGYTPHRLRFLSLGKVTERWRYYSLGLELIFDEEGNLLSERHFPPQGGHID